MVPLGITNTIDYHTELHDMVVGCWEKGKGEGGNWGSRVNDPQLPLAAITMPVN